MESKKTSTMTVNFEIKPFSKLSLDELHDCVSLRMEVFAVEQNAPYNDLDGYDKKAFHLIGKNQQDTIISTARILAPGAKFPEASFGRVVLDKKYRGNGLGHEMIHQMNQFISRTFPSIPTKISAMLYLKEFYESHGFEQTSDTYLDCGIEHIDMIKP